MNTSCSGTDERVDLGEHDPHRVDLGHRVGVGGVDDVQDQVAAGDLLQRRAERLDQLVGQVPDEADGVGERVLAPVGGLGPAHRRIQGGEQRVLDQHVGAGQPVEQRRLAGVGVAGERDARAPAGSCARPA